jgi:DNA-binding beta-propeller fold protein YncE
MRMIQSLRVSHGLPTLLAFAAVCIPGHIGAQSAAGPAYHLVKKVVLGGEGGWDYFTADPETHRIFIARGSYVMVVDPDGSIVSKIDMGKDNEAHAVVFAPDLHRAFTSNGGGNSVTIFDPETLKVIGEVKVPERDTDDILYEPATKRIFTMNGGKGHDATAIDAEKGVVVGSVPLEGKPESAQSDGKGHIYVNIEDKSDLSEIDAKTLQVTHTWPLAPCQSPSGQSIDREHSLLIIGCHNGLMEFWDYAHGKVAGTVPIGPGVDSNRFDPATGLAFASCGGGDGSITVAHEDSPNTFHVVQTITTQKGARTMALDTGNHNVYTVTSEFGPPPAPTAERPHPWPTLKPGTFTLMIYSLQE